ncbi:hypothetical protein PMAYCL1PPCAC_17231, partial [Pristionchus mayeri]
DEDTLDNLSMIGKDIIEKQANAALAKGIPLHMYQSPAQPATFYNVKAKLLDNGVYLASDLTITPALIGTLAYSGSCYSF